MYKNTKERCTDLQLIKNVKRETCSHTTVFEMFCLQDWKKGVLCIQKRNKKGVPVHSICDTQKNLRVGRKHWGGIFLSAVTEH